MYEKKTEQSNVQHFYYIFHYFVNLSTIKQLNLSILEQFKIVNIINKVKSDPSTTKKMQIIFFNEAS